MATAQTVCPLCGSANPKLYLQGREHEWKSAALGPSRIDVSPGRILRCRSCDLGFRELRPKDEELAQLYSRLDDKVYESESRGRARTALRHLKIVRRYANSGRLLDVGCASGAFLRCAAGAGWNVVGIEPSETLCDKAKTLLNGHGELICATLQEARLPPTSFDVVTLWDVLEHVPSPQEFMRACASLLKPGGYLFANVPNLDSPEARILGARWPLLVPEHLNYFNRKSLKICGEAANLTWLDSGRRAASFSIDYVLFRLAQHRVPGVSMCRQLMLRTGAGRALIPVALGELYGVWGLQRRSS
jgi:SAM-dependent methyltransferase